MIRRAGRSLLTKSFFSSVGRSPHLPPLVPLVKYFDKRINGEGEGEGFCWEDEVFGAMSGGVHENFHPCLWQLKNEKDKNLSNHAKSKSNICVCIYIYLSVLCIHYEYLSTRTTLIYLTCKREKEMKEKLSWPPSLPLTLTCYFIHSLSLSPPPSLSLSMKSPSQLPPQYQHQQQLETPYFFNTLTTTAQTIWKLDISDELFPSHHIMVVMENVSLTR